MGVWDWLLVRTRTSGTQLRGTEQDAMSSKRSIGPALLDVKKMTN